MACAEVKQQLYLYKHAERLQHLNGHISSSVCFLLEYVREMLQEIVFQEEVKESLVVLVTPDR